MPKKSRKVRYTFFRPSRNQCPNGKEKKAKINKKLPLHRHACIANDLVVVLAGLAASLLLGVDNLGALLDWGRWGGRASLDVAGGALLDDMGVGDVRTVRVVVVVVVTGDVVVLKLLGALTTDGRRELNKLVDLVLVQVLKDVVEVVGLLKLELHVLDGLPADKVLGDLGPELGRDTLVAADTVVAADLVDPADLGDNLWLWLRLRLGSNVDGDAASSRGNINDGPVGGTLTRGLLDRPAAGAAVVDGDVDLGARVAGAAAVTVAVAVVTGAITLAAGAAHNGAADAPVVLKVVVSAVVGAGPGSELHVAMVNVMVDVVMFVLNHGVNLRGSDDSAAGRLGVDTHS